MPDKKTYFKIPVLPLGRVHHSGCSQFSSLVNWRFVAGFLSTAFLSACTVELTFVDAGSGAALIDGLRDGLSVAFGSLLDFVRHPLSSLQGMTMAVEQWPVTADLFSNELHAYLDLPDKDFDAFVHVTAIFACCAVIVVSLAALFDHLLSRVPRFPWTDQQGWQPPPSNPVLRKAHVLHRARTMRLEHRLGAGCQGWPDMLRWLVYLINDIFSGLYLLLAQPFAFSFYIVQRLARWIGARIDSVFRGLLRQTVFIVLPLSMILHPWISYSLAVEKYAAIADKQLRELVSLVETNDIRTTDVEFIRFIDQIRKAFENQRRGLLGEASELDWQLDFALQRLDAVLAIDGLSNDELHMRISRLFDRYNHWRLFLVENLVTGAVTIGQLPLRTGSNLLRSYERELDLLQLIHEGNSKGRRGAFLADALQATENIYRYERCIALYNPNELLNESRPDEHACCGSRNKPLDHPINGCSTEMQKSTTQ